ncbi:MAG: GTP-binding protein [bacterium]
MHKPKILLVSIGHIDHGKSTLVGRLLYDSQNQPGTTNRSVIPEREINFSHFLDALEEERDKGITIDIVHTPFEGNKYRFEIIDCPGHKEFIKNMMGGATHASSAQLLVSAAPGEGIQEQTRRHLWLARLFGIEQVVVVVNKMDLAAYSESSFLALKGQVVSLLNNLSFQRDHIAFVPTSGKEGENVFFKSTKMPWWQGGSYLNVLENSLTPAKALNQYPTRFSVQSVSGNLVVGRVESGALKVRDALRLAPNGGDFRVLEIKGPNTEKAEAGESVGLALKGEVSKITRGSVLLPRVDEAQNKKNFKARLYVMSEAGLEEGGIYTLRVGLQETACTISRLSPLDPLSPLNPETETPFQNNIPQHMGALVAMETTTPVFVEPFFHCPPTGRLLLEREGKIIAAGVCL